VSASTRRFPWPWYLIVFYAIVLVVGVSLWPTIVADLLDQYAGCTLSQDEAVPCVVGGVDWNPVLSWMQGLDPDFVILGCGVAAEFGLFLAFVIHLLRFLMADEKKPSS
jgi:hypothetical protein